MGMVIGISLSTTVLYQAMSYRMGSKVISYLADRPDIFLYGMHVVYWVSFVICLLAFLMTLVRFKAQRRARLNTKA